MQIEVKLQILKTFMIGYRFESWPYANVEIVFNLDIGYWINLELQFLTIGR